MMKRIILIIVSLLFAFRLFGATWQMSGVAPGNVFDFDIDQNTGNLHVVSVSSWGDHVNEVIYTVLDPEGTQISQEAVPQTTGEQSNTALASPTIAVDQEGNPHICCRYFFNDADVNVTVKYTNKKNGTWLASPLTVVYKKKRAYFVRMAADDQNRIHVVTGNADDKIVGEIVGYFSYHRIVNNQITSYNDVDVFRADSRAEITADVNGDVHIITGFPTSGTGNGEVNYYRIKGGIGTPEFIADIQSIETYDRNGSPDVAADRQGYVHLLYGSRFDSSIEEKPSIRYVKYNSEGMLFHKRVTPGSGTGALEKWKYDSGAYNGWGLGSIAASASGQKVVIVYLTKDNGLLYHIESEDKGNTWSAPVRFTEVPAWGTTDGRTIHLLRSYKNNFYCLFPYTSGVTTIRMMKLVVHDETPPTVVPGGPYTGIEGQVIKLDASASHDDPEGTGINTYEWDLDNDGTYDTKSTNPVLYHTYENDVAGQMVTLRVTDFAENADSAVTLVTINNVAPQIDIGPDRAANEGDTVTFSVTITDPGINTHVCYWALNSVSGVAGQTVSHLYAEDGIFQIICLVEDDHKATDLDTLILTVRNLPPIVNAEANGPYLVSRNVPIQFVGTASDPGPLDTVQTAWDLNADGIYETNGLTATRSYANAGQYKVYFKAWDGDGGVAVDSAVVTITNDAPEIQNIPEQVVAEGDTFPDINLDEYVVHKTEDVANLQWTISGFHALSASLTGHNLHVEIPDENWYGSDTLNLVVKDLGNITDAGVIHYRVTPVNDPPVWKTKVPNVQFLEDESYSFTFQTIDSWITDLDHELSELTFSIAGQSQVIVTIDSAQKVIRISAPLNWFGKDTLYFSIEDPLRAVDTDTCYVNVISTNDLPTAFSLISPNYMKFEEWPDSIQFSWESSTDPDGMGNIYYKWELSRVEPAPETLLRSIVSLQTVFTWYPDEDFEPAVYKWQVKAINQFAGVERISSNEYFIRHSGSTGVVPVEGSLPAQFALHQNYPNPFNPTTMISYDVPETASVRLIVYNTMGQAVRHLVQGFQNPGQYHVEWDGFDDRGLKLSSGIYVYRLETAKGVFQKKLLLIQ